MTHTPAASPQIDGAKRPVLPRGVRLRHDEVRKTSVLLAPERTLALDEIAVAILSAVDGERTVDGVIDHLAAAYAAPRETIEGDVKAFLAQLAERRMLDLLP